ncbi:unnamed protein product [Caenorhabditis nigoni]
MEATRYQVKPKNENASYGNPSREQQLAHLRETLHDLPTAESLAELIIPSAPPLEETYEDNSAFSLYNGPVIPSAPPMEDSNHNGAVFQFQQSDQTVYSAIKNTPSSNVKASKTVSMISENINSDAGETHFFNKNLDSSCFIKSPTTYYSNEKSTVDSKTTWPEHVLSNDDHKIDNRYAPENIIPLFECVSSNNERKDKWRNICSSSGSQEKNISKDAKQKTTFSRLSERFKSFFKINNKRGQRHLRLGGGKKTVFTEELERLHGPSHNFDGYKDLMVLEQNEIDLVGELNAQVNDNAVFHLAFEMVYNFNKSLPRKFQDKNHIRLIHPSFLTLFLEHGMGEKLPEMTAFKSEEPCSRYLVPILRGNHFALVHVGKLEEIYHMHVFDSLRPTHPNSSPFISKSELNKLANLLAGKDVNTKITRVPEEHASMQTSAESNDCGICTVENVNACLKNKKFPTNTALYENWKVIDQMTTLRRTSFKEQLQKWIGTSNNTNLENVNNSSDEPTSSTRSISSIAFARLQRKRKNAEGKTNTANPKNTWRQRKEKQEKHRMIVEASRLEEKMVTLLDEDNEVVEVQSEHLSDSDTLDKNILELSPEPINNFEKTCKVSHKKELKPMRSIKISSIAFARLQRKRKNAEGKTNMANPKNTWRQRKEKQEKHRMIVEANRLEEKMVTLLDEDNEVVEVQSELSSDSDTLDENILEFSPEPINNFEKPRNVSHKKKLKSMRGSKKENQLEVALSGHIKEDNEAVNFTPLVSRMTESEVLESLLSQLDGFLVNMEGRATKKLLKEFKGKLAARLEDIDGEKDLSVSSEDRMFSEYETDEEDTVLDPNFWTERRKNKLMQCYKDKTRSMKEIQKRFHLSGDEKSARTQIARIGKCVTSKKWKKNEALYHLTKRVSGMTNYYEEQKQYIHESDIRRLAYEQSSCFGLRNFKVEQHQVIHLYSTLQASRKFVDTIKKRCSLVSRHVDGKISKRAVLRQSTTAQSIIDFKNKVVPRIRNQYAPDHIFNVDQTGIVLEETTKRTLAKRGTDKVFRVCQRDNPTRHSMTFNPCISADGKLTGKLFVTLYEPKPPRSFRQMVAPFTDLHVTHSTSGIMTTRLAEEWMEKCLLPSIPDRSVLLLDSWHGFDKMKVLRAVARKNLEIVTFPPRTTGQLQPLDLFFNRQLKCFLRKLQDEIRLKHNDFTISVRNNLLKVARFTQNQFQAPRFAPMIQRGFYELGIVTTRPTFDTPAEFCFDPEVGKEKCKTCTNLSFFKCAHCEETYCIKCTIDHFH